MISVSFFRLLALLSHTVIGRSIPSPGPSVGPGFDAVGGQVAMRLEPVPWTNSGFNAICPWISCQHVILSLLTLHLRSQTKWRCSVNAWTRSICSSSSASGATFFCTGQLFKFGPVASLGRMPSQWCKVRLMLQPNLRMTTSDWEDGKLWPFRLIGIQEWNLKPWS